MTPERLRTQLLTLLPSQLDDLVHDQLSSEEAAHVPTGAASPAERARAIVTLAGQNASLRKRLEAALRSLSGETTPATPSPYPKSAEAVREAPGEDVLFSWIHLSDLHFGYGDAEHRWDQRLVLGALRDDVAKMIAGTCPRPEAIFVTGDIGFSGATKSLDEYADAKTWLLSLAKMAGLKSENVFTVPGNHDVQRNADTDDRNILRLVRALRSGADALDEALGHKADAALLGRRQANYLAFAKDLAPASLPGAATPKSGLFWHHDRSTGGVLKIRVAGLNTALLAMDDEDRGKLRLGTEQIARALQSAASAEPTVVLALSHHPFSGGWLFDEKNVSSWVRKHAHVHLCGHVHEADAKQVSTGGGNRFITITAGASYGDTVQGGPPASHGYNLAALVRSSAGQLQLKVWPRRWAPKNADFRTDIDNVPDGQNHSLHDIAGIEVGSPVPPVPDVVPKKRETPVPDSVVEWITSAADQHRWIRIVGFQERYKIRLALEDIFVPLRTRVGRRKQQSLRGDKLAEDFVESRVVDIFDALRMASETPATAGLVVLGNPGAGKTTLLKQLFIRVAREGSKAVGLPEGLFPVLLRCSQLEMDDLKPRGLGLAVEREAKRGEFPGRGEQLIEARVPILFLLDGLDEVRDERARARLCEWLDGEVANWPGSRFVVTCRFAAWRREAKLDIRFVPVEIQMLEPEAVEEYVRKWFAAVERGLDPGKPKEAQQRATESANKLLEQLLDPKRQATLRLRELTENPLLLSTLCLVHHSEWKLPDRRGDLYDGCIRLLLENWTARRAGEPTLPEKAARLALQPLAWAMHLDEARDWPIEKVVAAIKKPLSELPDLPKSPEAFLERARDDCGVLASKDLGSYEFFHLSFQEYLAAIHAREQGLIPELASHAGKPWWREVVLLAVAQPAVLGELVRALAERSGLEQHREFLRECVGEAIQIKPEPFLEVIERGGRGEWGGIVTIRTVLEILGSRAPEAVLERARELTKHEDVAVAATARALVERDTGAVAGAPVPGQPFVEKTTKMSFLWVPPGKFRMGSSKKHGEPNYDKEANDDELPAREVTITKGFWIGKLPVTNAQFAVFLEATKARAPEYWRDSRFNAAEQPLVGVDWEESCRFSQWLTAQAKLGSALGFDLPTEAEWEYAARGSDGRTYPWGNEPPTLERADYGQDFRSGKPVPVGMHPTGQSPWGVQDMAGGVWEWCLDGWQKSCDTMKTDVVDPCHLGDSGAPRVVRGGSWGSDPGRLRCACRGWDLPANRRQLLGFRVVCRGSRQHIGS